MPDNSALDKANGTTMRCGRVRPSFQPALSLHRIVEGEFPIAVEVEPVAAHELRTRILRA
jgi:hypothetical protein